MKRQNFLNKVARYFLDFQEHRGIQINIDDLAQELGISREKLGSPFSTRLRRLRLNRAGYILRSLPDRPLPTTHWLVASKDGKENQEAIQYEHDRHRTTKDQAQERIDQHIKIGKTLGYDPSQQQLEGGKDASNSSDSEQ